MSVIKAIATVTAQSNPKSLTDGTALEAIIKKPATNAIVAMELVGPSSIDKFQQMIGPLCDEHLNLFKLWALARPMEPPNRVPQCTHLLAGRTHAPCKAHKEF